jgi:hypothetical protein
MTRLDTIVYASLYGNPYGEVRAIDGTTGATIKSLTAPQVILAMAAVPRALYAGGNFTQWDGAPRSNLAAIDPASGQLRDWNPGTDGGVFAMAADVSVVYVGGNFTEVGGQPRAWLAAIDAGTEVPPSMGHTRPVTAFLTAPFPNPFNIATMLSFDLATAAHVSLEVIDLAGRRVATPMPGTTLPSGHHEVTFRPSGLSAGVYWIRFEAGEAVSARKVLILR